MREVEIGQVVGVEHVALHVALGKADAELMGEGHIAATLPAGGTLTPSKKRGLACTGV